MISIYVDEAYAFDILSILYIKCDKSDADRKNYTFLKECIISQIGNETFAEIRTSSEYLALVSLNQSIYDMIDRIRKGIDMSAKDVDDANMARYETKRLLQEKFFSKQLTEKKY